MAPFRFGIVAAQASSGTQWKELATRAEAAGYSSLLMPDGSGPVLAPFSALATAAAVTTRLKVGNWVRLSRLAEILEIIGRLFRGQTVTFEGRYYSVRNSTLSPKLSQPIKVLVAASGPRAVKLAGERADIVALAAGSREHFLQQVATLEAAAGERFAQLELASIAWLMPDDDPAAAEAARSIVRRLSNSDVETLQSQQAPTVLAGSRESMIDQLQERRAALGLSYIVVNAQALDWFAPVVQRLAGT